MVVAGCFSGHLTGGQLQGALLGEKAGELSGGTGVRCALPRAQLYMGLMNRNFPF